MGPLSLSTTLTTDLQVAVDGLRRGLLVAFPTETVYGLGADAANPAAVIKVFEAKGRPSGHPLIVHLADRSQVGAWSDLSPEQAGIVDRLGEAFWPGPLTIVVPRSELAAAETVGGKDTIGLRVPDHHLALALLGAFGGGVAAPSANRFGRVSPTTAAHVLDDLDGLIDVVIDGGPTEVGVESTIVELVSDQPVLLRPGGISVEQLNAVLDIEISDGRRGEARAPGMLASHYAPDAMVELVSSSQVVGSDLGSRLGPEVGVIAPHEVDHQPSWCLSEDADGYARALYATLREADRVGVERLLIVPPAGGPLLDAVLDRLAKASSRRSYDGLARGT
ncbi:MAG: threonylcarbamoyl-AMP synthase [Actinomycetia bacterium]|nr:threonylcarbamoyl-AMP synthase [Actinomycetes bacterium]MCP4221954.1 threonylcarbamoyl-AMP synthase [Actinomycetes bacterium]MCP5032520.1 threonylcarbamoyl-AMP synthase [Actinomycetes bacterium]